MPGLYLLLPLVPFSLLVGEGLLLLDKCLFAFFDLPADVCHLVFQAHQFSFALAERLPFNAGALIWDPYQFVYLLLLYALFTVPFFCAANCAGLAFACFPGRIGRIYRYDLMGAGFGAPALLLPAAAVLLSGWCLLKITSSRDPLLGFGRALGGLIAGGFWFLVTMWTVL